MRTFTKHFMEKNRGCYTRKELNETSFMKLNKVTDQAILLSEIPLKDKFWFFCHKIFTFEQNQQIAVELAEAVLPIFEKQYPTNRAPRKAIEAIKLYLENKIDKDALTTARRIVGEAVAYAADASFYATDAAFTTYYDAANAAVHAVYNAVLTPIYPKLDAIHVHEIAAYACKAFYAANYTTTELFNILTKFVNQ